MPLKIRTNPSIFYFPLIAHQMKASCKVQSLARYRVDIPGGFTYGAFNGAAHVKPWSLIRMIEGSRAVVFYPTLEWPVFIDYDQLYKKLLIFVIASSLQVRKEFYDLDLVKAPLAVDVQLQNIGKTSFEVKSSAYIGDFPDPLFISRVSSVFICTKTRKPKSPPDWWIEKFSKEIPVGAKPMERLDMGGSDDSKSTESDCRVHVDDVDGYLHTNWSNHVKYCYNAFVDHLIAENTIDSSVEIFRELKDMNILYKNESSIGDSLMTRVSPHKSDANTFYFNMFKAQNLICEAKMDFHPIS